MQFTSTFIVTPLAPYELILGILDAGGLYAQIREEARSGRYA